MLAFYANRATTRKQISCGTIFSIFEALCGGGCLLKKKALILQSNLNDKPFLGPKMNYPHER